MSTVVLRFDAAAADAIRRALGEHGFRFEERPHALFLARGAGAAVTAYATGKILVTGADCAPAVAILCAAGARGQEGDFGGRRIGSDESGKGDYFGPLAVAAVAVASPDEETTLRRAGVRDSKTIPDDRLGRVSDAVEEICAFEVMVVEPTEYNALHARVGNLNRILTRLHADLIAKLAGRTGAERVVVDRFAAPPAVKEELGPSFGLPVDERPRAEDDVAVAAASVVARRRFLAGLAVLSEEAGVRLPKGAGAEVRAAAAEIRARGGDAQLARVAKMHFAMGP